MSSDDLIKNLVRNLRPVKRQSSPNVFAFKYLIVLVLLMVAGILILKTRNNIFLSNINFFMDTFFNILLLLSSIFITGWFSTVGRIYKFTSKFLMLAFFIAIISFNAYRLYLTPIYLKSFVVNIFDMKCFSIVMGFSLLSAIVMVFAVSKRIVLNPGLVGSVIGMLSFSVGSLIIGVHCPIISDEHVSLYHTIFPMLTGTLIGFFCGKVFLKL